MSEPTIFLLCGLSLAAFVQIRNTIVFRVLGKANDKCYELRDWTVYESKPSYGLMMLDLRKWTFKQFYPELCA